jgi:hypothetical protein
MDWPRILVIVSLAALCIRFPRVRKLVFVCAASAFGIIMMSAGAILAALPAVCAGLFVLWAFMGNMSDTHRNLLLLDALDDD